MNRIEAIYQLIDENDKVVDVGCDQAKLSILLAKRNQSSIASDISEKVIIKAKVNHKAIYSGSIYDDFKSYVMIPLDAQGNEDLRLYIS